MGADVGLISRLVRGPEVAAWVCARCWLIKVRPIDGKMAGLLACTNAISLFQV